MNASELKRFVFETGKVEEVLNAIGCHSIKKHGDDYWTAGNWNGDNSHAITIYNDEYLRVINYTRQISKNPALPTDIINLVEYNKDLTFVHAIKYLCEILGLDFYSDPYEGQDKLRSFLDQVKGMNQGYEPEENIPLKPISDAILSYYHPWVNDLFKKDNIPYRVQREWEIGYDESTNRITIPIRDELGQLVGIKGRLFGEHLETWEKPYKYVYIEPCPRNKILYGLYKTEAFIKQTGRVFVGESEKSVLQMWSYGCQNCVGIGGKKIGKSQVEKLTRLGAEIVFAFDKDVTREEIENISKMFIQGVPIWYLYDDENILNEKESPSDNPEKFEKILKNLYKVL